MMVEANQLVKGANDKVNMDRMKRLIYLILAALILIIANVSATEKSDRVDEVRVFKTDLLGMSEPMVITLRIIGESFTSPFKWSIIISNSTGTLFSIEHDDEGWDDNDDGYGGECKGYTECKRQWYFHDLPGFLKNSIKNIDHTVRPVEEWEVDVLKLLAGEFLKKKRMNPSRRSAVIKEMLDLLPTQYLRFCPPLHPEQNDACYMYVPSLGYFVPYWDD